MTRFFLLMLLSCLPLSLSAKEFSVPTAPAELEMFWVARYMEFNDLPMSIRSFKTRERADRLVPRLKTYLEEIGGQVQITQDQDGWTTLATADDKRFYSIRLAEQLTETAGVFTVSGRTPINKTDIRLPLGFMRIEKQAFFDGPSIQEFTVLGTSTGQEAALATVERMMRQDGWSTTRNYQSTRYFSRGKAKAHATAQVGEKGAGTLILISKELVK